MPVWLIDLLSTSPILAGVGVIAYYVHKALCKLIDSPLSIAAIFGVVGTKTQREDAREMVKLLRDNDKSQPAIEVRKEDDQSAIDRNSPPSNTG